MPTRTGGFAIGVRQGWSEWQRDVATLAGWLAGAGFEAVDLGGGAFVKAADATAKGLRLGSVDLLDFGRLLSSDAALRQQLVEKNLEHIRAAGAAGVKALFTCLLPGDPTAKRADNYRLTVDTYAPLCQAAAEAGTCIAVEGYPGGPPHYAAIGCTPETVRALLKDLPGGLGLNYDPSHLVRLGVDPVRFLGEFAPHVVHCHAKDTELFADAVYEYGLYQPATFARGHGFGEHVWRYTLPGHGVVPWSRCFALLKDAGYRGVVSVELEDEHFNGTEAGEKEGLVHSLAYLRGA